MVKHCPHCGLNAWFPRDDVCPSCHIHIGAPVTPEDTARIHQIATRPDRSPALAVGASAGGLVAVWIFYKVVWTLLAAASSP